jgi:hypothetical protein
MLSKGACTASKGASTVSKGACRASTGAQRRLHSLHGRSRGARVASKGASTAPKGACMTFKGSSKRACMASKGGSMASKDACTASKGSCTVSKGACTVHKVSCTAPNGGLYGFQGRTKGALPILLYWHGLLNCPHLLYCLPCCTATHLVTNMLANAIGKLAWQCSAAKQLHCQTTSLQTAFLRRCISTGPR